MELEIFRTKIKSYLQQAGVAQGKLASELGLHPSVLSHKLRGNGVFRLSQVEVRQIVKILANEQVINSRDEAIELLELMNLDEDCFSETEWATPPLSKLKEETKKLSSNSSKAAPIAMPTAKSTNLVQKDIADNLNKTARPQHNLPRQATPLIGRTAEIKAISDLLQKADVRLITLFGMGGIGKTRLALQTASEALHNFQDGVWFVQLAAINDSSLIPESIVSALGLQAQFAGKPNQVLLSELKSYLRDRQILLVLDNFEQLMDGTPLIAEILEAAPQLKILVTSRVILRINGEYEFEVPPLNLPNLTQISNYQKLSEYGAIDLFVQRARTVKPDFELNVANAIQIADICIRLDGLALAIELAAAWLRVLTPSQLLNQLRENSSVNSESGLLTRGRRDLPTRHQTLRNTLDWSYHLLESEAERKLFQRLSVFVGGGNLEAIKAVWQDMQANLIITLSGLLEKSLIRRVETNDEARFTMLATVRDYATEKLNEGGEANYVRRCHAQYFVQFVLAVLPETHSNLELEQLNRLEKEYPNVHTALDWFFMSEVSIDKNNEAKDKIAVETILRVCIRLGRFWYFRNFFREGLNWLQKCLAMLAEMEPITDRTLMESQVKILSNTANFLSIIRDPQSAKSLLVQSRSLAYQLGDKIILRNILLSLGSLENNLANFDDGIQLLEESLNLCRELDDEIGVQVALNSLGIGELYQQNFEVAADYLKQAVEMSRKLGLTYPLSVSLLDLGMAQLFLGDFDEAEQNLRESFKLILKTNEKLLILHFLHGLAGVYGRENASTENLQQAARLLGAAESLRENLNFEYEPSKFKLTEQIVTTVRSQMSLTDWQREWEEGRKMTLEKVLALIAEEANTL